MKKKIAMITGATSGFGNIFAKLIDEKCASVDEIWIVGRNTDALIGLSNELKHKAILFPCDLTRMCDLRKIKSRLLREKPAIKMLVNAAGFGIHGHVENQDEEELAEMLDLNCRALTYLCRVCIPYMARNSRIVNFASVAAFMPQPSFAVYAASKSYVLSLTRALNVELKKKDIYALAVCPGPANTNFFNRAEEHSGQKAAFYKEAFMVEPEGVVNQAFRDSIAKKEVSVYSLPMKALHTLTKILPQKLIYGFLK